MTGLQPTNLAATRELEALAVDVAGLAAELVRTRFGDARATRTKSTLTDVVTDTDLEAEELIRRELTTRSPGSTIVGEEFDDQLGDNDVGWIVDPIDGTVNFLYELPVVSVSIAATQQGTVVAGAVTDVVLNETFSAAAGDGARCDGSPIVASTADDLATSLVGTGFAYDADRRANEAEIFSRILPEARDIRCFGSAALHLCWVGCGRLDAYYQQGLKIYDYAAGALVAAEAGAFVEAPAANDLDLLLATAPLLANSIRGLITDADKTLRSPRSAD